MADKHYTIRPGGGFMEVDESFGDIDWEETIYEENFHNGSA